MSNSPSMEVEPFLHGFPPFVPHQKQKSHVWKRMQVHECKDSVPSKSITDEEEKLCLKLLSDVSNNIQCRLSNTTQLSLDSSPHWNKTQMIKYYTCSCRECPVMYQVRRSRNFLAIYKYRDHLHPPRKQHGLNSDAKASIQKYITMKNGVNIFMRNLKNNDFPHDAREAIANGADLFLKSDSKKFKRQCENYVANQKKKIRNNKLTVPSIGQTQNDFYQWIRSKHIEVDDLPDLSLFNSTVSSDKPAKRDENIIVLSYLENPDRRTGQIVFTSKELLSTITMCAKYFEKHPDGVLAELDYTKGFVDTFCFGCLGFSDANRTFHPVLFDINYTENSDGAKLLLQKFIQILARFSCVRCHRVLKDGGSALSSAARSLELKELSCLTHMTRKGWGVKKGHGSGYMGSLPTYLRDKACSQEEIKWLTVALLSLRYIPSVEEYQQAIHLFRRHVEVEKFAFVADESVKNHVYKTYFPMIPNLNLTPIEPRSTNGLERTLGISKQQTKLIYEALDYPSLCHAFFHYIEMYESKDVAILPKEFKKEWDIIINYSNKDIPLEFKLATAYNRSNGERVELNALFSTPHVIVYCPTLNFLTMALDEAKDQFLKVANNMHHSSLDAKRFSDCVSYNFSACAHLQSICWQHLKCKFKL